MFFKMGHKTVQFETPHYGKLFYLRLSIMCNVHCILITSDRIQVKFNVVLDSCDRDIPRIVQY